MLVPRMKCLPHTALNRCLFVCISAVGGIGRGRGCRDSIPASAPQDKRSNYDTDVFLPLFDAIREVAGCPRYEGRVGPEDADLRDTAYRYALYQLYT